MTVHRNAGTTPIPRPTPPKSGPALPYCPERPLNIAVVLLLTQVLGPSCSQADVYTSAVSDVVADVLRGYNGTILAYGQTGWPLAQRLRGLREMKGTTGSMGPHGFVPM